ncbi:MAG TPA: S8 family serine peptidase [Draconibacterium sp.]|nr:S8 family serine peptidase [Draconibacterium sp.]
MKHLTFQTFCALCMVMFLFSSCEREIEIPESTPVDEPLQLKSANVRKDFMVISNTESLTNELLSRLETYGKVIRTIPEIGVAVVRTINVNFEDEVAKFPEVKGIVPDLKAKWINEPVMKVEANIGDGDPGLTLQWGLKAIHAREAWNAGYTGKGVKVFILDGGIDPNHPDLIPNLNTDLSTSFVSGEDFTDAIDGHGTHVAGIIAAAEGGGAVIGVAPRAEIVMVKVLSSATGSGSFSDINAGIIYAAKKGADIINMSLGATLNKNGFFLDENGELQKVPAIYIQYWILAQKRAIDFAMKRGSLVITSAGNNYMNADGNGSLFVIPADFENVIAVSATAPRFWYHDINSYLDYPASYSNTGRSLISLAAPGGDNLFYPQEGWQYDMVLSTYLNGSFAWSAGTSMASPFVAGVAALIVDKYDGKITPKEITKKLYKTADQIETNGRSVLYGHGRVNAFSAVTE